MLVDSHCHLHLIDYAALKSDLRTVIQSAKEQGVSHMLCVSTTLSDVPNILAIVNAYQDISASVGLHPNEQVEIEPTADDLIHLAKDNKIIAIGETGLDYYRLENDDIELQKRRFCSHISAALNTQKPLIIHTRQAKEDTLDILKNEHADRVGGVMHCFTEDWQTAKNALDLNFCISFSGIVTFKNAVELQEVAKKVPLDKMLIETDSPYLAPIPHRGKINQPLYVKHVAEFIAELRGISFEEVALATSRNFYRVFLPHSNHSNV